MPSTWVNFGSEVVVVNNMLSRFFPVRYRHVDPDFDGHEFLKAGQECECTFIAKTDGDEVDEEEQHWDERVQQGMGNWRNPDE